MISTKPYLLIFLTTFLFLGSMHAQQVVPHQNIQAPAEYENIYVHQIASDSLSSSFIIFIKQEVKMHKHEWHTENVVILEGEGVMTLGSDRFVLHPGDVIFIPKNTWHSVQVSSDIPLKVLSIQSPNFDGSDRVIYKNQ